MTSLPSKLYVQTCLQSCTFRPAFKAVRSDVQILVQSAVFPECLYCVIFCSRYNFNSPPEVVTKLQVWSNFQFQSAYNSTGPILFWRRQKMPYHHRNLNQHRICLYLMCLMPHAISYFFAWFHRAYIRNGKFCLECCGNAKINITDFRNISIQSFCFSCWT